MIEFIIGCLVSALFVMAGFRAGRRQGRKDVADEIKRLRAVIIRAKDALLDGQSTQWVHDLLVAAIVARRALKPKP